MPEVRQQITSACSSLGHPLGPDFRPAQGGFGTELLEHMLAYEQLALPRFEFTYEGLHCSIEIPVAEHELGS